jgi:hypothetical protein
MAIEQTHITNPEQARDVALWNVYALCDPRSGAVRYVGVTARPLWQRLKEHIYEARNMRGGRRKCLWLAGLLDAGKRPYIILLARCSEREWESAEKLWVRRMRRNGTRYLLNEADGGLGQHGRHHSPLVRQKIGDGVRRAKA